jgi:hypothetical protein
MLQAQSKRESEATIRMSNGFNMLEICYPGIDICPPCLPLTRSPGLAKVTCVCVSVCVCVCVSVCVYVCAIGLLQECCESVPGVLQECYKGVRRIIQRYFRRITGVLQGCKRHVIYLLEICQRKRERQR